MTPSTANLGSHLTIQVDGVNETLKILRQTHPDFVKFARKEFRLIGKSVEQRARSLVPEQPPLSHWGTNKTADTKWARLAWSKQARTGIKVEARRRASPNPAIQGSLVNVVQSNPAGMVFDMAGKHGRYTKTKRGVAFNRNLTKKFEGSSRSMWRAVELERDNTERAAAELMNLIEMMQTKELA